MASAETFAVEKSGVSARVAARTGSKFLKFGGDVVAVSANFSDATGHVAIMISGTQSIGTSSVTNAIRISNFGTSFYNLSGYPGNNGFVYRRYVGN